MHAVPQKKSQIHLGNIAEQVQSAMMLPAWILELLAVLARLLGHRKGKVAHIRIYVGASHMSNTGNLPLDDTSVTITASPVDKTGGAVKGLALVWTESPAGQLTLTPSADTYSVVAAKNAATVVGAVTVTATVGSVTGTGTVDVTPATVVAINLDVGPAS